MTDRPEIDESLRAALVELDDALGRLVDAQRRTAEAIDRFARTAGPLLYPDAYRPGLARPLPGPGDAAPRSTRSREQ